MDEYFETLNGKGEKVLCQKLHTFKKNGINYIIYTDFEPDESGDLGVLASSYKIENNELCLYPINTKEEWDMIDKEWQEANINA